MWPKTHWSWFQSLDWVDVDFDLADVDCGLAHFLFQSLDWVDVDFDMGTW